MPFDTNFQQYQQIAQPPPSAVLPIVAFFESAWHQPYTEPVRVKIAPRLAIALIASGLFAPVLNPETQIIQTFESRWHQAWSEPVRIKPRLRTGLNLFNSLPFPVVPTPSNQLQGWYKAFAEPQWPKKGLKRHLQMTMVHPERYLPPANVTMTMNPRSVETTDGAEFDVNAYDTPFPVDLTAVEVSITEISATSGGSASITEDDG